MTEKEYVDKHTIYKVLTGSRLYGTDNKDSDIDMRGVCIVGKKYYFGFFETFEQYEDKEDDTVIFNIKKVLSLMANCNPNMFDLLFAPREFWQQTSVYWEEIWKNRESYLGRWIEYRGMLVGAKDLPRHPTMTRFRNDKDD